jgi:mannose-6-phosphate isomerase-like protein (cupin superfamily)
MKMKHVIVSIATLLTLLPAAPASPQTTQIAQRFAAFGEGSGSIFHRVRHRGPEPGARSAWHSHPGGQYLIVTSGTGWVQEEGGQKREIKPGDVIWTPPGVKHWHGATATNAMSHIAITNVVDGKTPIGWSTSLTHSTTPRPRQVRSSRGGKGWLAWYLG